ncbi:MAG: SpoIIE family protein phosphatase [Frankiaceae bacterium]
MEGSGTSPEALLLRADDDAAAEARRLVAETLAGGPFGTLVDDAQLVATELVTNALLHGAPPVALSVELTGSSLRIEVSDGSSSTPLRGTGGESAMTGRGMVLVESLAARWGVERTDAGKLVWAELEPGGATGSTLSSEELIALWGEDLLPDGPERAARYPVEILDVPTDLLIAAKTHVDNVIREFTLASAGAQTGRTAAVPAHLAHLLRTVVTRFAEARHEIKRQALVAIERGDARTRLHLLLPVESADAGEAYLVALDEVEAYCRAARLLTLESPPQHRLFRRWYVEELVRQLRAADAGTPVPPLETFEARLLGELDTITEARESTDRAARLYRVAAALAGAVTAEQVAEIVLAEAVAALGASAGGLIVPADGHLSVPGAVGYSPSVVERIEDESPETKLPAAQVLLTGEPVWLESRLERDRLFPELTGLEPTTVSMCAVPIEAAGRRLGALRFSFTEQRLFDEQERTFVSAIAAQAAQALDRARGYEVERAALERARRLSERLAFLADASQQLAAAALDFHAALTAVTRICVPRLADWCALHVLDRDRIETVAVVHSDPALEATMAELADRYPVSLATPGGVPECLRTGQSQLVPVVTDEMVERSASDPRHLELLRQLGLRSAMIVPLKARGVVFGTVTLVSTTPDRTYGPDDLGLAEQVAARAAALAADNARLFTATQETALTLQRSLLPPELPVVPGVEVAAAYHPIAEGSQVGGDFYDIWQVEDGLWAFAIGDVSGTGPLAAGHTAIVRHTLRALTITDREPVRIMHRLNAALLRVRLPDGSDDRFCTAIVGLISTGPDGIRIRLANAGHPPPVLRRGSTTTLLGHGGGILGLLPDIDPVPEELAMRPGTALILYTDGVIESRHAAEDHEDELIEAIARAPVEATALRAVVEHVALHGTGQIEDDVATLVLVVPPTGGS